MEGGGVKRKRRSHGSAETSTRTPIVPKKSTAYEANIEGLVRENFSIEREASRQDEIAEFLRRDDCPLHDIRTFGESTMRLLCEIHKIADSRGQRMSVQISSISIPSPEVISAMKQAIEGLIEDIEDVKNTVLSRTKKVMTPTHSGMAAGKGLHDKKRNVAADKIFRNFQDNEKEAPQQTKGEGMEQRKGVTRRQRHAVPSGIAMNKLPFVKTQLNGEKRRLRRKKTRIMCQHCCDKPRSSIILRCKHSLYCHKCLRAGEEKIRNCPGCGKDTTDVVIDLQPKPST